MFYCDKCAAKKQWPITMFRSGGKCEICGDPDAICSEVASKDLPIPPTVEESEDPIGDKMWLLSTNMQCAGGSFVKALGVALLAAGGYQQTLFYTLLCHNWPDWVAKYRTWPYATVADYERAKGPSTPFTIIPEPTPEQEQEEMEKALALIARRFPETADKIRGYMQRDQAGEKKTTVASGDAPKGSYPSYMGPDGRPHP